MTYQETVEYLYAATPVFEKIGAGAYKEGLANTHALDEHLNHPHRHFKTIHVAGTNGKGSVSHTLTAILQHTGLRVGLYTSPHLVDFRERIRVNGVCVSEAFVVDFVERHRTFFEPLHPSFFELTTAMAFDYFAQEEVDIAVIEVGLGGRLDCTNIITPLLSVITNISFDHTQFLGNTLPEIAAEKGGIIKEGIPVVIGEADGQTRPVFERIASQKGAPIIFAQDQPLILSVEEGPNHTLLYHTAEIGLLQGQLSGACQPHNTRTVLTAIPLLREAGISITDEAVRLGFSQVCQTTGLMGRWQQLCQHPTVVCDTGHNVGGWQYIARQLKTQECRQLRIVFGMVDDKDINTVMDMLPHEAAYYFTKASSHRAISEEKVKAIGLSKGLEGQAYPSVKEAFEAARKDASSDDFIFVGGSSYVVADLLAVWEEITCQPKG